MLLPCACRYRIVVHPSMLSNSFRSPHRSVPMRVFELPEGGSLLPRKVGPFYGGINSGSPRWRKDSTCLLVGTRLYSNFLASFESCALSNLTNSALVPSVVDDSHQSIL